MNIGASILIGQATEDLRREGIQTPPAPAAKALTDSDGVSELGRRSCPKCNGKGFTVHEYPTQRVFRACECQKRFASKPRHSPNSPDQRPGK
jgi:hypothetical protein